MNGPQRFVPWLLLLLLVVLAGGGATLGVLQSPTQADLHQAVANTLAAPNYTSDSVLAQSGGATESQHLVWQAPNRLGGYVQSQGRRSYVAVIGGFEFQSSPISPTASTAHLTFVRQASQPASSYDPVRNYLALLQRATQVHQSGGTSTFVLDEQGQVLHGSVTVVGQYVDALRIAGGGASVGVTISSVGSSPPVALPSGAKISTSPAGSGTGSAG
jgi:hypothetical protein